MSKAKEQLVEFLGDCIQDHNMTGFTPDTDNEEDRTLAARVNAGIIVSCLLSNPALVEAVFGKPAETFSRKLANWFFSVISGIIVLLIGFMFLTGGRWVISQAPL